MINDNQNIKINSSINNNNYSNIRHGLGIFFYPTGDVYFGYWK